MTVCLSYGFVVASRSSWKRPRPSETSHFKKNADVQFFDHLKNARQILKSEPFGLVVFVCDSHILFWQHSCQDFRTNHIETEGPLDPISLRGRGLSSAERLTASANLGQLGAFLLAPSSPGPSIEVCSFLFCLFTIFAHQLGTPVWRLGFHFAPPGIFYDPGARKTNKKKNTTDRPSSASRRRSCRVCKSSLPLLAGLRRPLPRTSPRLL